MSFPGMAPGMGAGAGAQAGMSEEQAKEQQMIKYVSLFLFLLLGVLLYSFSFVQSSVGWRRARDWGLGIELGCWRAETGEDVEIEKVEKRRLKGGSEDKEVHEHKRRRRGVAPGDD